MIGEAKTAHLNTKEMEQMLWGVLSASLKPITGKALARMLNISVRTTRKLIRDMIAQGYQIASSMEPPYGYFVPKTSEERRKYSRQLKSRIREIAKRLRDFDKITAEKIEQLVLVEED